ncbi:MAG: hypothetical protein IM585_15600 [Pseudanabaena sp. M135S2SP2A07QC]|jgi:hypothetical protein|uniref:hypothetical protein n=1 Tax=unclassified Microcystis TaxID=2643300 RepID=UPI00258A3124|nr:MULTISPECIES: hypothetical protein [unclassified Microcystis]MCA6534561.1 hypothetical protein [Pseudanabaena sp. M176S2SP2A07QC]MCA6537270.1 hypothetical protein [Pseudanabaena sp. M037S2SP2A07QC]MCA6548960.1 hypothetical protein [Pseudanabaena sp. M152S2SP2A07QC]MCA6553367.1 hypothetical protein [Pseudanabaena sp. M135S2SP2A07QC]MCA6556679.1 hypothetical protein [Pseudanabaena sp. M114S2SP2A07QC]MCA6564875.1 hypothetical protein [Pseudanabaena sp. M151S2SP2A07QC]MCA6571636.1 hypothetica
MASLHPIVKTLSEFTNHPRLHSFKQSWLTFLLPLTCWIVMYFGRPKILGFYQDDWYVIALGSTNGSPWSAERFEFYINLYINRPVTGIATYIWSSICNDSPLAFQIGLVLSALAVTLSLRLFFISFLRLISSNALWIADIVSAFWLVIPWTIGFTVSPTYGPCQLGVILFSLSGFFLFSALSQEREPGVKPAIFFLLSCLSYELFYGQFIILLLIGLVSKFQNPRNIYVIRSLPSFVIAQIFAIVWNRFSVIGRTGVPSKSFNSNWFSIWQHSTTRLPEIILQSIPEYIGVSLVYFFGIGVILFTVALTINSFKNLKSFNNQIRLFILILLCFFGLALANAIQAIAGYGLTSLGVFSRTTIGATFWMLTATIPMYVVIAASSKLIKYTFTLLSIFSILSFGVATNIQIPDWAMSWQIQQQIVATAPVAKIANTNINDFIIAILPDEYNRVPLFQAGWEINGAIGYTYPNLLPSLLSPTDSNSVPKFLIHRKGIVTTLEGQYIKQSLPQHWEQKTKVNGDVYVWRYKPQTFYKASPDLKLDVDVLNIF